MSIPSRGSYSFHTYPLFPLDDAYERGVELARRLRSDLLTNDYITYDHDAGLMAQMIVRAGHGDHLEIGTLYGGSACLAGMIKKEFGLKGTIYAVDPLTGYYDEPRPGMADRVRTNLAKCGVSDRVRLIEKKSFPWPEELEDNKFVSAFVDGDHSKEGALRDWLNVYHRTSHFVMFDNYDYEHPDSGPKGGTVLDAVHEIFLMSSAHPWFPVYIGGISCIFGRWDTLHVG